MTDDTDHGLPGDTGGDTSTSYDNRRRIVLVAVFDMLCWPLAEFFTLTVEKLPYLEWRVLEVTLLGMGYQLLVGLATALYRRRWLPFSFEELGMAALTTGLAGLLVMLTGYAVHGHPQGPVIWFTASATDEVGTSKIASTLSTSYQVRAMLEPTSGLFWWSAPTTSIFSPALDIFWKSSTASLAAVTDPGPAMSAYRPDMSFMTPILMTPSEICAFAAPADRPNAVATRVDRSLRFIIGSSVVTTTAARKGPILIQTPSTSCSMDWRSGSSDAAKCSITRPCSMT